MSVEAILICAAFVTNLHNNTNKSTLIEKFVLNVQLYVWQFPQE